MTNFAGLENFWNLFDTAFGTQYDYLTAFTLKSQWQSHDFSSFPQIEVVSSDVLGTANGAYAISTNKIYLSDTFVETASQQSLEAVILEEYGHFVDAQVNQTDTAGDEGELFSAIVRSVNLSAAELSRIKTEDDHAVVMIDGQAMAIETDRTVIANNYNRSISPNSTGLVPYYSFDAGTGSTLADQFIIPLNYTATSSQGTAEGGSWNYFDDTNNQLIDGILGVDDWTANLGNGEAYEWVGWFNVNPTLNFNFGNSVNISQVQIGFSRAESVSGIYLPDTININGFNFTLVGNEILDGSRGFINFNGNFTGSNLSISLTDSDDQWIFIDEIRFNTFPSITLAVAPANVLEDGTSNLVYTLTRTGATTSALTVNYTIAGTATNGTDYATIGTSVVFAANSATATVTVNPTADTTIENNETVALTLATGTGYTIGTTTAVTGTITNDDFPSITLAVAPASVLEDGTPNLIYTFTRTGATTNALTVNYGITGTATNGTDYATIGTSVNFAANSATATVTVNPTADTTIENNETVALTLATGTSYTIGTTTAVTGTITNDDGPTISLGLNYSAISEDSPSNFIYTFTRTGATTNSLTVNYSIAGTALSTDYTGATPGTSKTITFAAGSATATLTIDPTADTTLEPNETIILQLVSGTGYTIVTTAAQTATIINDDNTRNQQGTNGNSVLLGKNYSDYLTGGTGNDILNGAGNGDYLTGAAGNDTLTGGSGSDTFFFANPNLGIDTITDFTPNEDTIFISASGFGSGLIAGNPLTQTQFILGSSATSASQRFIYNSTNGALLFDADGNGLGTSKQIATLSIGLALTCEDIFVG